MPTKIKVPNIFRKWKTTSTMILIASICIILADGHYEARRMKLIDMRLAYLTAQDVYESMSTSHWLYENDPRSRDEEGRTIWMKQREEYCKAMAEKYFKATGAPRFSVAPDPPPPPGHEGSHSLARRVQGYYLHYRAQTEARMPKTILGKIKWRVKSLLYKIGL